MKKLLFISGIFFILLVSAGFSVNFNWTNTGGTYLWENQANWDIGDGSPGDDDYPRNNNDYAVFNTTYDDDCNTTGDITIGSLGVWAGYNGDITLGGNFTVDDAGAYAGNITIAGAGAFYANVSNMSVDGKFRSEDPLYLGTGDHWFGVNLAPAANKYGLELWNNFYGGTGNHYISTLYLPGGQVYLTSGVTEITGYKGGDLALTFHTNNLFHQDGTVLFTGGDLQELADVLDEPNTLYNVIINKSANKVLYEDVFNLTIAGNLTIINGEFDLIDDDGEDITNLNVTGNVNISGNLTGRSGNHSFGSLTINSGGIYNATNGTTNITSVDSAGNSFNNSGTFIHNDGEVYINSSSNSNITTNGDSFYDLNISASGTDYLMDNLTVDNRLNIITSGALNTNISNVSIDGDLIIDGSFGANTAYTLTCRDNIDGSGTFDAPNATGTFTVDTTTTWQYWTFTGTFNHNNGTLNGIGGNQFLLARDMTFYNINSSITGSVGMCTDSNVNITVENTFTINAGSFGAVYGGGGGETKYGFTLGTATTSGSIVNDGTFYIGRTTKNTQFIKAANSAHPWTATGNDWDWDYGDPGGVVAIENGDLQFDATTGGNGVTVNITGDMTIDAFSVTSGDTLKCVTPGVTITGVDGKFLRIYGDINFQGTNGNRITVTGQEQLTIQQTPDNITLKYCDVYSDIDAFRYEAISPSSSVIEHCSFHTSKWAGVLVVIAPDLKLVNCTLNGSGGSGSYDKADLARSNLTGVNPLNPIILDNCTLVHGTVGLRGPGSGGVVAKDYNGSIGEWKYWGVMDTGDASSGYRASDWNNGNITISNADEYNTAFNTSIILNETGVTAGNITINTNTTLTANTSVNFTANGYVNISGTLNGTDGNYSFGSLTINSGGEYNATSGNTSTGTVTVNAGGTFTLNNGSTIDGSGSPTTVTNAGTWYWNNCSLQDLDLQWDVTTPNSGYTINFTGDMTIDLFTLSDTDSLECTAAGTTITGNNAKYLRIKGDINFQGTSGNRITVNGAQALYIDYTADDITLKYSDFYSREDGVQYRANSPSSSVIEHCSFHQGTGWDSGVWVFRAPDLKLVNCTLDGDPTPGWGSCDISRDSDALAGPLNPIILDNCTLVHGTVGLEDLDSGGIVAKDYNSNLGEWKYYGVMDTGDAASGYRASDWNGANITITNADEYNTAFNTTIILNETGVTAGNITINTNTTLTANTSVNFTTNGYVNISGTLNGTDGNYSFGSLTVNSGGVYNATNGTTTITSGNVDINGAFTHNSGIFDFTAAGAQQLATNGSTFYDLNVSGTSTLTVIENLTIVRDLNISGTLVANNENVTLGNTTVHNGGNINTNSSNLTLNGYFNISGDTTWNNCTIKENISYDGEFGIGVLAGGTLTITNNSYILFGDTGSVHWNMNIDAATSYSFNATTLAYGNNTGATMINATDCTDAGNNVPPNLWDFGFFPNVTINYPTAGNYSGVINIYTNVTDDSINNNSVYFWFENYSGGVVANQTDWLTLYNNSNTWNFTSSYNTTALNDGYYNITINASDVNGNANTTEKVQIFLDNTGPVVNWVGYVPNTTDDIDPGTNINVTANVTDTTTFVDNVTLQYKKSYEANWISQIMLLLVGGLYTGNFTTVAGEDPVDYIFRIFANDSLNNTGNSSNITITSATDKTWTVTPSDFGNVSLVVTTTGNLVNMTINNTGDYILAFTIVSNWPGATTYNRSVVGFTIASGAVELIEVNVTAAPVSLESSITINTTCNSAGAVPTSNTTNGTLISYTGGPYFLINIPTYPTVAYQSTNITLQATIQNVGNETAENTTLNWTLLTGWTNISGAVNYSIGNVSASTTWTANLTVNLSASSATAGTQTIYVNASGIGVSNNTNDSTSQQIILLCNGTDNICGSGCTAATDTDCSTSTPGDTTGGGGGGGAAGGRVEFTEAKQTVELVSGKTNAFQLLVENIFPGAVMNNVTISVEGFLIKYIKIDTLEEPLHDDIKSFSSIDSSDNKSKTIAIKEPISAFVSLGTLGESSYLFKIKLDEDTENETFSAVINDIAYNQTKAFYITIEAPAYMEESTYTLVFTIRGIVQHGRISRNFIDKRTITLEVHIVSREDAQASLTLATQALEELDGLGVSTLKVQRLLKQANESFEEKDYEGSFELSQEIIGMRNDAFAANEEITELEEKTNTAIAKGIDVSKTLELLYLAQAAFERGAFDIALERIKEAESTYSVETKGEITVTGFLVGYWWLILVVAGILMVSGTVVYRRSAALRINKKLASLSREADNLHDLREDTQRQCFEEGTLSETMYHKAMYEYDERLSKIKAERAGLISRRVGIVSPEKEHESLKLELKKLNQLIREAQDDFYVKETIAEDRYERRMEEYTLHIAEAETNLASVELIMADKKMNPSRLNAIKRKLRLRRRVKK